MLSFIVPAYDCADVVAEAVESAVAQRLDEPLEVVVVDDGSPDATYEVLRELATHHEAVRVLRHDENRGGGAARNTAASNARGDLLYMLDADNILPDDCVQPQLDLLRGSGASAVAVETQRFVASAGSDPSHEWVQAETGGWSTLRHAFEALAVPASHGNYLYTTEMFQAVGAYDEDLGAMDTWSFGLKHLARGFDVAIAEGTHYLHRIDRPGHDSYWTRDERRGQNDWNALVAVRRERERLPEDLRRKADLLEPGDPFFDLVASGAFGVAVEMPAFMEIVSRARRERRGAVSTRLRAGVARFLRR